MILGMGKVEGESGRVLGSIRGLIEVGISAVGVVMASPMDRRMRIAHGSEFKIWVWNGVVEKNSELEGGKTVFMKGWWVDIDNTQKCGGEFFDDMLGFWEIRVFVKPIINS